MKTLYVYADFDWLKQPTLIGKLGFESLRGSDSYCFEYDYDWLKEHCDITLSDDLNCYAGPQYTIPDRDIFCCFADALPDRWGRMLLNRKEQIQALAEKRAARRLTSFDYLTGIDDTTRMGGFRFKTSPNGEYINCDSALQVPPLSDIRTLIAASNEIERSDKQNELPNEKWLRQLVNLGSSLGGARPKACVTDEKHILYVAKFPSRNDTYDVALWEHVSHLLAKEAGIDAANTKIASYGNKHHTLLSRRFDRDANGHRKHFASAMTLLGLTDGCNAQSGNGYLDIVDFIVAHCCDTQQNLNELFRRVAFNIAIGNSDDHFRNHGFLLTKQGWTLSPAYDMNPTDDNHLSLLINSNTCEASLEILQESAGEYMIDDNVGKKIIAEVTDAVRNWRNVALRNGATKHEIDLFAPVFSKHL